MKKEFDLNAFSERSREILSRFQNKKLLREHILRIPEQLELFDLCEHYDILDKIVLFSNKDDLIRVRLHIFADGFFDRPHNHRWTYSSHILSGGYQHTIYVLREERDSPNPQDLIPVIIRQEKAGDFYTLHSSQFHSVIAEPDTVTLIVRGPPDKDRFRLFDMTTKEAWWQYGASTESEEDKMKKRMSVTQFNMAVSKLEKLGII